MKLIIISAGFALLVGSFFLYSSSSQNTSDQNTPDRLVPATIQQPDVQATTLLPAPVESLNTPDVAAVNCRNTFLAHDEKVQWQHNKKSYIEARLADLQQQGVSENVLDKVAINTSIGLFRGRNLRHSYLNQVKKPPYTEAKVVFANPQLQMSLLKQARAGEFVQIAEDITAKVFKPDAYYIGKKGMVFLLSYLLEFNTADPAQLIELLIDSGITVTHADLVKVSQLNIPEATLNRLYLSSDLPADKVLKRFGKYTSLALVALQAKNIELASYWISMDSPLQPDLFYDNGLDVLANNGGGAGQSDIDAIFAQMAAKGLSPYWPTSYKKLKALISPSLFSRYELQMKKGFEPLQLTQLAQAQSIVDQIHRQMLKGMVDFALDSEPQHPCFSRVGRRLTKLAMGSKTKKKVPKRQPQVDLQTEQLAMSEQMATKIAAAKNLFSDDQGVEAHLGEGQGLASKLAVERFRRQQMTELAKTLKDQFTVDPVMQEVDSKMTEIYRLANAGKWNEAVDQLNRLDMPEQDVATALLMLALNTNPDFAIIKQLLDRGGKLMPNAIGLLIVQDNADLAGKLLPFGLDIHYVAGGYSTLARSVERGALKMFKFLLEQGVEIDSHTPGFDALDIALRQFNIKTTGLTYVSRLITAGANIELSHKQIVDQLKVHDMPAYFSLTSAHNELKL